MPVNFNGVSNNSVNPQRPGATERTDNAAKSPTPAQQAQSSAASAKDSVSLSARAEAMKQAEQQLRDQPEVNDARVAEIRQALQDGSFKIDAEQLAQKMLDMDNSIFG